MKDVRNPYFSVEIHQEQIQEIKKIMKKVFQEFDLPVEELPNPHITISYLLGAVKTKNLEVVAEEIAEAPFKMKVLGLDLLESSYYGGTLIVLKLEHSDDFLYAQEYLKETLVEDGISIKKYKGGFKAHISLFLLKDIPKKRPKNLLVRYLELCLSRIDSREIIGNSFCIYNDEREKLFSKKFK